MQEVHCASYKEQREQHSGTLRDMLHAHALPLQQDLVLLRRWYVIQRYFAIVRQRHEAPRIACFFLASGCKSQCQKYSLGSNNNNKNYCPSSTIPTTTTPARAQKENYGPNVRAGPYHPARAWAKGGSAPRRKVVLPAGRVKKLLMAR